MAVILEPTKRKLELMSDEIDYIIAELENASYNIYEFLNYKKIIDKLKKALRDETKY